MTLLLGDRITTMKLPLSKNKVRIIFILGIIVLLAFSLKAVYSQDKTQPKTACLCPPAASKEGSVSYDGCKLFEKKDDWSDKKACEECEKRYCTSKLGTKTPDGDPEYKKFNCDWKTEHSCTCPPPPAGNKNFEWHITKDCEPKMNFYCEQSMCKMRKFDKATGNAIGNEVEVKCTD